MALGSADLLKLTAKLGRGLKEESFAGTAVPAAGLTKEWAKEELALLQKDKVVRRVAWPGNRGGETVRPAARGSVCRRVATPPQ